MKEITGNLKNNLLKSSLVLLMVRNPDQNVDVLVLIRQIKVLCVFFLNAHSYLPNLLGEHDLSPSSPMNPLMGGSIPLAGFFQGQLGGLLEKGDEKA